VARDFTTACVQDEHGRLDGYAVLPGQIHRLAGRELANPEAPRAGAADQTKDLGARVRAVRFARVREEQDGGTARAYSSTTMRRRGESG
jgi:hypothetical protein